MCDEYMAFHAANLPAAGSRSVLTLSIVSPPWPPAVLIDIGCAGNDGTKRAICVKRRGLNRARNALVDALSAKRSALSDKPMTGKPSQNPNAGTLLRRAVMIERRALFASVLPATLLVACSRGSAPAKI